MTIRSIEESAIELHNRLNQRIGDNSRDFPKGFPVSRSSFYLLKNGKMPLSWKKLLEVFKYLGLEPPKIIF